MFHLGVIEILTKPLRSTVLGFTVDDDHILRLVIPMPQRSHVVLHLPPAV